jgi:hypothetical protein
MKNMVAPTFRSARAELKLSATTRHQPGQRPRGHFLSTSQGSNELFTGAAGACPTGESKVYEIRSPARLA